MNINRVQKFQQHKSPPTHHLHGSQLNNHLPRKRVFRATQVNQHASNNKNSRIFKNNPPQEKLQQSKVQLGSSKNKKHLFQRRQISPQPRQQTNFQTNNFNININNNLRQSNQNPYNLAMTNLNPICAIGSHINYQNHNVVLKKSLSSGKIPFKINKQLPKERQILNSQRIVISNISNRLIQNEEQKNYTDRMHRNGNANQDSAVTIPRNYNKFVSQPSIANSPKTTIPNSAHFIHPFQMIQSNNTFNSPIQSSVGQNLFFNSETRKLKNKNKKITLLREGSQINKQQSSVNRPTSRSKLISEQGKRFIKLSKSLPMKIGEMYESSDFRPVNESQEQHKHDKLHIMKNKQNEYQNEYYQTAEQYNNNDKHLNRLNEKKYVNMLPSEDMSNQDYDYGKPNMLKLGQHEYTSNNQIKLNPKIIQNQHSKSSRIFNQIPGTVIKKTVIHHSPSPSQLKNVIKFNQHSPSKITSPKNNSSIIRQTNNTNGRLPSVIIKNQSYVRPQSVQIIKSSSTLLSPRMNQVQITQNATRPVYTQNRIVSPQYSSFHVNSARISPQQTIINQRIQQQHPQQHQQNFPQNYSEVHNNYRRPHSSYDNFQFQPPQRHQQFQSQGKNKNMVLLRDSKNNQSPSIILHQSSQQRSPQSRQEDSQSINQSLDEQQYRFQRQLNGEQLPLQSKPTSPQMDFTGSLQLNSLLFKNKQRLAPQQQINSMMPYRNNQIMQNNHHNLTSHNNGNFNLHQMHINGQQSHGQVPFMSMQTQTYRQQEPNRNGISNPNDNNGWLSINRDKVSISEYCVIKKNPMNAPNVLVNPNNHANSVYVQNQPSSNSFHIQNVNNSTSRRQNNSSHNKQSPINIINSNSTPTPPESPYYMKNSPNNPIIEQNSFHSQDSQEQGNGKYQYKYQYGIKQKQQINVNIDKHQQSYGMPTQSYNQKYRQYYNANDHYNLNEISTNNYGISNNSITNYQTSYNNANQNSQVVPLDYSKSFLKSNGPNQYSQNSIKDHYKNKPNRFTQAEQELKQSIFENNFLNSNTSLNQKDQNYQGQSNVLQKLNYHTTTNNNIMYNNEQGSHKNNNNNMNVNPGHNQYVYKRVGTSNGNRQQEQKYSYCE